MVYEYPADDELSPEDKEELHQKLKLRIASLKLMQTIQDINALRPEHPQIKEILRLTSRAESAVQAAAIWALEAIDLATLTPSQENPTDEPA